MSEIVYIYVLIDPFIKQVRYVGKTINPKSRLFGHYSTKDKTYRSNWIASLRKRRERPIMEIVEETDEEHWEEREKYWIKYYRELGCKLVNATEGGEGVGIRIMQERYIEIYQVREETFERPDWHVWVYGGYKRGRWGLGKEIFSMSACGIS